MEKLTRRDFLISSSAVTLATAASPSLFASPRLQRVFVGCKAPTAFWPSTGTGHRELIPAVYSGEVCQRTVVTFSENHKYL